MKIKDIAELAGVSISTVSKIINNKDDNINIDTRNRVLKIVKEYNYTPYGENRKYKNTKTFIIGVLLQKIPKSNSLIQGIMDAAQKNGYSILLLDSHENNQIENKHISTLCKNEVDGVLWEPLSEDSITLKEQLNKNNIPYLFINDFSNIPDYQIDFAKLGYEMTNKLIEFKHYNIACLLDQSNYSNKILEGYKKCLYDNDIQYSNKLNYFDSDEDYLNNIINYGATGIICSNFTTAVSVYEQMAQLHYSIPNDFSILTLKDNLSNMFTYPRISGIQIPYYNYGHNICEELINLTEKTDRNSFQTSNNLTTTIDYEDTINIPSIYRKNKIIVVGSINIDNIFNVNRLPQSGKTITIHNSMTIPGGKGLNQAVGVSRLDNDVLLIGQVGNDTDSTIIFNLLEKENMISESVQRNQTKPTGKAYIYLENNGESAVTVLPGANESLSPNDIEKRKHDFKNAEFCLISSEISVETATTAASIAKEYGAKVIFKPSAIKKLPADLIKNVDIFVANRSEASIFCTEYQTIEEQAQFFYEKGIETVIITLGREGCYLKNKNSNKYFSAANFNSIDTTGGADAFISGLASYLTKGYPLEKSIEIANYAAGFCISRSGVTPALVDKDTLEAYILMNEPSLLNND
jgi:ribokinase